MRLRLGYFYASEGWEEKILWTKKKKKYAGPWRLIFNHSSSRRIAGSEKGFTARVERPFHGSWILLN